MQSFLMTVPKSEAFWFPAWLVCVGGWAVDWWWGVVPANSLGARGHHSALGECSA